VLRSSAQAIVGEQLIARLAQGRLTLRVDGTSGDGES
jgi:hypothetical protein